MVSLRRPQDAVSTASRRILALAAAKPACKVADMIALFRPLHRLAVRLCFCMLLATPAQATDVTVYAAASLGDVLADLAVLWQAETGGQLTPVLAGSSAIARQVQAGAPADIVILANPGWMDVLEAAGDIDADSRADLLTNRLVLIGAEPLQEPLDLRDASAVTARLGEARLALALTEAVPAGIYARAALESLDLWEALSPNVVEADNVRAALALVALRAVEFGFVYATDAMADPRVSVLAEVPADTHPPISYPVAQVTGGDAEASRRFLALLDQAPAQAIFTARGFGLASPDGSDD